MNIGNDRLVAGSLLSGLDRPRIPSPAPDTKNDGIEFPEERLPDVVSSGGESCGISSTIDAMSAKARPAVLPITILFFSSSLIFNIFIPSSIIFQYIV